MDQRLGLVRRQRHLEPVDARLELPEDRIVLSDGGDARDRGQDELLVPPSRRTSLG
jgi:hypothetical protein